MAPSPPPFFFVCSRGRKPTRVKARPPRAAVELRDTQKTSLMCAAPRSKAGGYTIAIGIQSCTTHTYKPRRSSAASSQQQRARMKRSADRDGCIGVLEERWRRGGGGCPYVNIARHTVPSSFLLDCRYRPPRLADAHTKKLRVRADSDELGSQARPPIGAPSWPIAASLPLPSFAKRPMGSPERDSRDSSPRGLQLSV